MNYDFDPTLKSMITRIKPPFNSITFFLSRVKARFSTYPKKVRKVIDFHRIKVKDKEDKFNIFIFNKKNANINLLTPIFYLHGGAFAFKSGTYHYQNIVDYVLNNDVVIYYLDFDTKLLHPHLEKQVEKAFHHLNLKSEETILMGDSSGCYLVLDLFKKMKKAKALVLLYPVVTNEHNFLSKTLFKDTPMWNDELNTLMWERFLKNQKIDNFLDIKLENIPKTYIETCEYDCLRDEGVALANKLQARHFMILKAMHGFDIVRDSPLTKEALKRRNKFIEEIINEKL